MCAGGGGVGSGINRKDFGLISRRKAANEAKPKIGITAAPPKVYFS